MNSNQPKYAYVKHRLIQQLITGKCRFSSAEDAERWVREIQELFTMPKAMRDRPAGDPLYIWIKGYEPTDTGRNCEAIGSFGWIRQVRHEGRWTLRFQKAPVPADEHPERKRILQRQPDFGVRVIRWALNGHQWPSIEHARQELRQLSEDYPDTARARSIDVLELLIFDRGLGTTLAKRLEVRGQADGRAIIEMSNQRHEPRQAPLRVDPSLPAVEQYKRQLIELLELTESAERNLLDEIFRWLGRDLEQTSGVYIGLFLPAPYAAPPRKWYSPPQNALPQVRLTRIAGAAAQPVAYITRTWQDQRHQKPLGKELVMAADSRGTWQWQNPETQHVAALSEAEVKVETAMESVGPPPPPSLPVAPREMLAAVVEHFNNTQALLRLAGGQRAYLRPENVHWTRPVEHPLEVLDIGEHLTVRVETVVPKPNGVHINTSAVVPGNRVAKPNPWTTVAERHPEGSVILRPVKGLIGKTVIVELETGVNGACVWEHTPQPAPGTSMEWRIGSVDVANRRVNLQPAASAIPAAPPTPPPSPTGTPLTVPHPGLPRPGDRVGGTVNGTQPHAVFLRMDDGSAGTLPWTGPGRSADVWPIGKHMAAVVLRHETNAKGVVRLILGAPEAVGATPPAPQPELVIAPRPLASSAPLAPPPPSLPNGPMLVVAAGRRPGTVFALPPGSSILGRTDEEPADLDLNGHENAAPPQISPRHARLVRTAGGVTVEDLVSLNGTFVNDARLTAGQPRPLTPEDHLTVGGVVLQFRSS